MTDGPHDEVFEPEVTAPDPDETSHTHSAESTDPPPDVEEGTTDPDTTDDRSAAETERRATPDDQHTESPESESGSLDDHLSELPPPPTDVPTPPPLPPRSDRPELVRTNGRRVLAGVASGIGEYLDISPWIPRLVFIFFTGFGGFGLLAYLAAWLLVRREDEPDSIAERLWEKLRTGQNWLGAMLVFIAALIIIASFDFLRPGLVFAVGLLILGVLLYRENIGGPADPATDPPPTEPPLEDPAMTTASFTPPAEGSSPRPPRAERAPAAPRPARPPRQPRERSPLGRWTVGVGLVVVGIMAALDISGAIQPFPRHYAATLLAVTGGGLLVGTFVGRARWLIVPGLILLPIVIGASYVDIPFDDNFTVETLRITPATQAELLDVYNVEAGSFTLDLSDIPFEGADSVRIDMGAGELTVILPADLEANVDVRLGVGDIGGVIGSSDGIGLRRTVELNGANGPLDLDIELGAGEVDVVRGG